MLPLILGMQELVHDPEPTYVSDPELLGRVPMLLLILGGIYITCQLLAHFFFTLFKIS
jgi:hypothetical protein